jgi:hypothetical protein
VRDAAVPAVRVQESVRAGWGLALLLAPDLVVRRLGGASPGRATRAVARVLGARHVSQAVLTMAVPSRQVLRWGGFADLAHATTDLVAAAADVRYRRAALIDAGIAATLGVRSVHAGDRIHAPATASITGRTS